MDEPRTDAPPATLLDATEIQRLEKKALQRLEVARGLIGGVNRVFLFFSVSLVLLWVQRVLPDYQSLLKVERARTAFLNANAPAAESRLAPSLRLLPNADALERDWQKQVDQANKEQLKLPGGFDLEVPAYFAPIVWTLVCLSLLWYLAFGRRRQFALMGRALRVLKEEAHYQSEALTDLCPALPWWLFPLPRKDGASVSCVEFQQAGGWLANRTRLIGTCVVAFGLLLATQFFTLSISWRAFSRLASQDKPAQFALHELTIVVFVLTALWVVEWLRPTTVPDQLARDRSPNDWSRRNVVVSAAALFAGVLAHPLDNVVGSLRSRTSAASAKENPNAGRNPRFKRKKRKILSVPKIDAPNDALFNPKSRVVHYVGASAQQCCLRGIQQRRIDEMKTHVRLVDVVEKPFVPQEASQSTQSMRIDRRRDNRTTRLHASCATWSVERAAEELVQQKDGKKAACRFLRMALAGAPRTLRLYDRLAVLTLDPDLQQERKEFLQFARRVADAEHMMLTESKRRPEAATSSDPVIRETGWWREVWSLAIGRSVPSRDGKRTRHTRRPHRVRCGNSAPRPRHSKSNRLPQTRRFGDELAARITAWENPSSGWRRRRNKRAWMLPAPATKCKRT